MKVNMQNLMHVALIESITHVSLVMKLFKNEYA